MGKNPIVSSRLDGEGAVSRMKDRRIRESIERKLLILNFGEAKQDLRLLWKMESLEVIPFTKK